MNLSVVNDIANEQVDLLIWIQHYQLWWDDPSEFLVQSHNPFSAKLETTRRSYALYPAPYFWIPS